MIELLKIWSISHFKRLKANTALTLFGIALGVAIFTAIQAANQNIRDSFQWTIHQIAGKGDLFIMSDDSGFPEEAYVKVRKVPGVKEAMPMILQPVSVQDGNHQAEVIVLGVDLLQGSEFHHFTILQEEHRAQPDISLLLEPHSIILSEFLANRFHLRVGSNFYFKVGSESIQTHVAGILHFSNDFPPPYDGYFAIMDIASSQLIFHKLGRLDRLSVQLEGNVGREALEKEIQAALPGLLIQSPEQQDKIIDSLLRSFNLNLKALSAISVVVGMFLIYNTLSILVVRRKVEIGILRSVGLSGKEVFFLILLEAFMLGTLGSIMGIAFGLLISRWVLKAVSLTITSLYLKVYTQEVSLSFSTGIQSYLIGLGVSLLAASFPAWEASRILPRDNLIRHGEIQLPRRRTGLLLGGILSVLLSGVLVMLPPYHQIALFGYLSALFLLLGLSFMIPTAIFALNRVLGVSLLKNRLVFFKVAGSGFFQQPARNSIGIAALMVSIALLISVTLMIHSFRKTVDLWFNQTIKADFVIEPAGWLSSGPLPLLSSDMMDKIRSVGGVAAVDPFREDHLIYNNEPYLLNSRNLSIHREYSQYLLTEGNSTRALQRAIDQEEVLISEKFSLQHHLNQGDVFTLNTPSGLIEFKIGGIFYDYTTQGGKIVMDRSLYLKYWKDPRINVLAIYLDKNGIPKGGAEKIRNELNTAIQGKDLLVISNQEVKSKVMDIFDETFAITRVLEWITILISLLGVVNMLLANILDQKREIGIMRSLGASRNQIGTLTLYEAGWMALIGNLVGAIGGLGLSLILIFVINKQSFLWTIQFDFSGMVFLRTFVIVMVTALLAGYFPAREAAKGEIAEAVHYE